MTSWLKNLFLGKEEAKTGAVPESKDDTKFPGIVVGKIIEINDHPNADRLCMTKVDIGSQKLDIVCGGPNVEVGKMVAVAVVGSKLPNGKTIKEIKVRGELSKGMVCADDELGLGQEHETIRLLKPDAVIGEAIDNYL
ncbi:MAG: YtpR family tRNA-binding protein [bacterium]